MGALIEKGNKNQLDGAVAAGKKFNGVIGYEVPTDWKELEVRFTPDFWSGKDIVFIEDTAKTLLEAEERFDFVRGYHISSLLP